MITRNEARAAWAESGLAVSDLSWSDLERLRSSIDAAMEASGAIGGTLKTSGLEASNKAGGLFVAIRCKARHFDDREAVTFNRDGFVGFAGWADDKNIQPILTGFMAWLPRTAISGRVG